MIVTKMAFAAPHVPSRNGYCAGAAIARCDGSGAVRRRADGGKPGPSTGLRLHPDGHERCGMDACLEGHITDLSPSLGPLAPVLDQLTIFTNLELRNAYTTGNHASANCAFLSCAKAKRTEGTDYQLGTTVDQLAAQSIGKATPIPSLELGHRSHRPGRQLRQRLRVRVPEQPVVVVAQRRRCRPKRIRASCSSGCSATAASPISAAPSCRRAAASSTG